MKKQENLVHIYDTSGTIVCKGIDLVDAPRPMEDKPLKVTFDAAMSNCDVCKTRLKMQNKMKVLA